MIPIQFPEFKFRFQTEENNSYIFDFIRKKYVLLTPEEWVRQNVLHYLIHCLNYPAGLCSVEKEIKINNLKKRYDIVFFNQQRKPWMLIECKEPNVAISDQTLTQIIRYHQNLQCPFWFLTNGKRNFCAQVHPKGITWLDSLPLYNS